MGASQEFDTILSELGDFGVYQIKNFALLSLPVLFAAAFTVTYVFTAGVVPHRCLVPECGDLYDNATFLPPWLDQAIPRDKNGDLSSCYTFTPLNSSVTRVPDTCRFDNSTQQKCDEWIYQGPEQTIMTEFSLTCVENAWKLTLVGSVNSFGRLVGLPLSGYFSDRYGRKSALILTLIGGSVFGVIRAFSVNYVMFIVLEFFEAIFSGGIYGICFILAMELVGPKRRVMGGAVIVISYALGQAFLGLFAMWLLEWRKILLVLYAPALAFFFYIWLIPESVRWLMSQGRLKDASRLILRAASTNKVKLSPQLQEDIEKWKSGTVTSVSDSGLSEDEGEKTWAALKQVAKSRTLLLRLANCSFCWVTNTLVYYGLSLNSVSLAGTDDIYLNFILVSLVEAPAYIFTYFGTTYLGRRRTLCTALLVSGLACFVSPYVPQVEWIQLTLYLAGKFAITSSFDTLYVFTAEMFPTRLRTSLLGLCSMVGRVGSILAPQTPLLAYISPLLPMTLFGSVALVACLLSLLFPETLGHTLPDSVLEAEQLGKKLDASEALAPGVDPRDYVPKLVVTSDNS